MKYLPRIMITASIGAAALLLAPAAASAVPHAAPAASKTAALAVHTGKMVMLATRSNPTTHQLLAQIRTTFSAPSASGVRQVATQRLNLTTHAVLSTTYSTSAAKISGTQHDVIAPRAVSGGMHPDGSGNCCSDSGRWDLQVQETETDNAGLTLDIYHSDVTYCWGGGNPGVNWGSVYNCDQSPGSAWAPYTTAYYTNVNSFLVGGTTANGNRQVYFNWDQMGYSYHTGFESWQQGQVTHCVAHYGCVQTTNSSIDIWVHANGEYDFA